MKLLLNIFFGLILLHQIIAFSLTDVCKKEKELCKDKRSTACEKVTLCKGGELLKLDANEKQQIVDAHNKHRDEIANGAYGFPKAAMMATVEWDSELEAMSSLNIGGCKYGHDACRNTETYRFSGQNIAMNWASPARKFNRSAVFAYLVPFVDKWFEEYKDCPKTEIKAYTGKSKPNTQIGHFTAVVTERSNRIGCAAVWFADGDKEYVHFGCNYASTNMRNFPVYTEGATTSKCKTGVNPKYKGLCSTKEQYDINDLFKMYPHMG